MEDNYICYLTKAEKQNFIEQVMKARYKSKYHNIIFAEDKYQKEGSISFNLFIRGTYNFVLHNNSIPMEAILSDFECKIREVYNKGKCYDCTKEYAKWVYGELRLKGREVDAMDYKAKYNEHKQAIKDTKIK